MELMGKAHDLWQVFITDKLYIECCFINTKIYLFYRQANSETNGYWNLEFIYLFCFVFL